MKKRRYVRNTQAAQPAQTAKPRKKFNSAALRKSRAVQAEDVYKFAQYEPPPGVLPKEKSESIMAMDSTPYDYLNQQAIFACQYVQYHFPGYQLLAMWSQFPEYRKMSETIAKEMTRKWITLTSSGDVDKTDRIKELTKAMEDYCVQDKFRQCAEMDGFFGRGQLYIDLKTAGGTSAMDKVGENNTALILDPKKITKGSLVGFNPVEPVWTYPGAYNSVNPLAADYYKPTMWYVMASEVHATRLLMFRSREVPDMLKAAYNFGGLSLSQLAKPYVDNWIRTRKSVGDMVHSYSLCGIKTDMATVLNAPDGTDCDAFFERAELFNNLRDSRSLMLLQSGEPNTGGEEFFQFNTPLSTLDKLQAQAQEQVSAIPGIPLVKFWGITPSGLNASTDGEIRMFYDSILAAQQHIFAPNLRIVMDVIMLSLWGEIDEHISFKFEPLWAPNDVEKSQIRKTNSEADNIDINSGVISSMEARKRKAADPDSGYNSIDVDDTSELKDEDAETGLDEPKAKDDE